MPLASVLRAVAVLGVAALAMGCQGRPSAAVGAKSPAVGTTRLMAAELTDTDDAPRVGKPQQHAEADADDEMQGPKDASSRRDDRRSGGGFSGYK